jgi:hypothetical protein
MERSNRSQKAIYIGKRNAQPQNQPLDLPEAASPLTGVEYACL